MTTETPTIRTEHNLSQAVQTIPDESQEITAVDESTEQEPLQEENPYEQYVRTMADLRREYPKLYRSMMKSLMVSMVRMNARFRERMKQQRQNYN